jgi:hypothetical protein
VRDFVCIDTSVAPAALELAAALSDTSGKDLALCVRRFLNGDAPALPASVPALVKVARSLQSVEKCVREDVDLPASMHKSVKACVSTDPVLQAGMMKALGQDIDDRMKIAVDRAKMVAAKPLSGAAVKTRVPHPVLVAMGQEGRLRAMWEYYNVWCETRPGFGKPAIFAYKEGSYVNVLFQALQVHLSPEEKASCLAMKGPKDLRDFVGVWYQKLLLTLH